MMQIDLLGTAISLLTLFGLYALMALSLNLEYGIAGVPNFGQALFVSVGAYTAGVTYTRLLPLLAGQAYIDPCGGSTLAQALALRSQIMKTMPLIGLTNFLITLALALLIGGMVCYLASYPALRLKEEGFFGLVLLVARGIVGVLVRGYPPLICGSNGLAGLAQPFHWVADKRLAGLLFAGLILLCVALVYWLYERMVRSPFGRLLKALRENDQVAAGLGKNVARTRGQVMFVGSAIAALAGAFFVVNTGYASANDYGVGLTLDVWVMVVLGGLGNQRGALLGALIITVLDRLTAVAAIQLNMLGLDWEFNYVRYMLFGAILLIMLRYRPQGLLPEPARTTVAHRLLAEKASQTPD
ncbi:MAG TPA: branched-chain amino acid ABC transporter permease [Caldilineaceae bacterium]|nr:branched-chain amino acid ABC transporter permease [Caldilineaceae bacterium]